MPDREADTELDSPREQPDSAWKQTVGDARDIAAELESEGWETLVIITGHTQPVARSSGDDERFGLVHVVPDEEAERFAEIASNTNFPRYRVFRNQASGQAFQVTQLLAPERTVAVLVVGSYPTDGYAVVVEDMVEEDTMYTHLRTLDKSRQWTVRHEGYEGFLPELPGGDGDT